MKLQFKIILLLSSIFGIIILTFLSFQYIQIHQKKLIFLENAKNQEIVIDKVLQLNSIKYEQLINDNSGWDEMVDFTANPDKEWAKDNVDFFVNSFKLSFVLVYNKEMKLVYQYGDSAALKNLPFPDSNSIKRQFEKSHFPVYFQYAGNRLFQIYGATIVPASDSDLRRTAPQGYLFIGKVWDQEYLDQHAQATSYQAELFPASSIADLKKAKSRIYITRNLPDDSGKTVATVAFSKIDRIKHDLALFLYLSLFITFIALVAIIVFWIYFRKIVLVPISQISQTLYSHNPDYIASFHDQSDEFNKLASLIIRSFEQEEQLKINNAELVDTNATKDKLFSIIAHDLKNPVGNILMISQLLHSTINNQDEAATELITMIEDQANETLNLLGTLFEWAKSQTGQLSYDPEQISLEAITNRITEHLLPAAQIKNIAITTNCSRDTLLLADLNMLETILRNLITNAIKFTREGGNISIYDRRLPDQQVEITVEDNGIGMDAAMQARLFRVDTTHSTNGTNNEKGTGLGLILCRDFIERHGGTIRVISSPGMGSKFIFTMPVAGSR